MLTKVEAVPADQMMLVVMSGPLNKRYPTLFDGCKYADQIKWGKEEHLGMIRRILETRIWIFSYDREDVVLRGTRDRSRVRFF